MPLYVIRPDDPPAGEDWQAVVPGQYVYDVTGVYATLSTSRPPSNVVCYDASPNGNDGAYVAEPGPGVVFVPGLVAGDDALETGSPTAVTQSFVTPPFDIIDWLTSFTVIWWQQLNGAYALTRIAVYQCTSNFPLPPDFMQFGIDANGSLYLTADLSTFWETAGGVVPYDSAPHMCAVTYDHGTQAAAWYFDGAPVANVFNGTPTAAPQPMDSAELGFNPVQILDEFATFRSALSAGDIAAIFAAAAVSFDAYASAVLALAPNCYYHLDGSGAPGTGRQVVLDITDGTNLTEALCSGFDPLSTPGPYAWSWLPNLGAAAESPDSATVTVPLPKEILPAGYTIGTDTLDIGPDDQWSDIAIWWNSDIMDSGVDVAPYAFPPGALLVYQQIQGAS